MFRYLIRSDAVEIEAPIDRVWEVLADFGSYGEWNPFTIRVNTDSQVGSPVDLYVTLGPLKLWQRERIEVVDPPRLLVWSNRIGHAALLFARREQRLEVLGATRCRYLTTDAFTGLLTPVVVLFFGRLVRNGFNAMAAALKERAEGVSLEWTLAEGARKRGRRGREQDATSTGA